MTDQQANLNLGMIGNCQINTLVDEAGTFVWGCMPQFDSDPVFCSLLDNNGHTAERGFFAIELEGCTTQEQRYQANSAVLETDLWDEHGNGLRIVDFAPRFQHYGRSWHPVMLIRCLQPLAGSPRVRVRLRPAYGYGSGSPELTRGSNHIRYVMPDQTLRLTTDLSLSSVIEESVFSLQEPCHLVLGPDESIERSVRVFARDALDGTRDYWTSWVRGLAIPFEWQDAVIRAAITLKLCTFEDTGAVIAAATTSVPEAPDSGRNWDYRFCWLRDSYFVVQALNRLGATKTMEGFLRYILDVASNTGARLQPVYAISGNADLTERQVESLAGYRGMGPVRVGNQAYEQIQNDVYGSVVLSATQYFFDERFVPRAGLEQFRQLEALGEEAVAVFDTPDAGLWEYRGRAQVHTFSAVMCWCAVDRLARIADHLGQTDRASYWAGHARTMHDVICERGWNEKRGAFTEGFDNEEMDSSLLLLHSLGFLAADDPRFVATVERIGEELRRGRHMFRYKQEDDFGAPENAFNICTFWYIEALASIGQRDEARELFDNMLECRNALGLLSEDMDTKTHELWGNFPQTYSMVGIINSARILSEPWESAL